MKMYIKVHKTLMWKIIMENILNYKSEEKTFKKEEKPFVIQNLITDTFNVERTNRMKGKKCDDDVSVNN